MHPMFRLTLTSRFLGRKNAESRPGPEHHGPFGGIK